MKTLALFTFTILLAGMLSAANFTPISSSDFQTVSTWNEGSTYPQLGDNLLIDATASMNLDITLTQDHAFDQFISTNYVASSRSVQFLSASSTNYTLTIDSISMDQSEFNLIIGDSVTLVINGGVNLGKGTLTVAGGGKVIVNGDLEYFNTADLIVEEGAILTVTGDVSGSMSPNTLTVSGYMELANLYSGSGLGLEVGTGGFMNVTGEAEINASGMDILAGGLLAVGDDLTFSGTLADSLNGALYVGDSLFITNNIDVVGSGVVEAHAYEGDGTLFGSEVVGLTDGETYQGGSGEALPVEALPIALVHFTAEMFNQQVSLSWRTASEKDNDYFTIERSVDGINFEEIYYEPGAGNSTTDLDYFYNDQPDAMGVYYYRLKQTDYDGASTYSEVVSVNNTLAADTEEAAIYFSNGFVSVSLSATYNQFELNLYSVTGALLTTVHGQDVASLQIPTGEFSGEVVIASLVLGGGQHQTATLFIP